MKVQEMTAWFILIATTIAYFYVMIWLCWLVVGCLCVFFTQPGKELLVFAKSSKAEVDKVVWPTRQETIQTTLIVVVMVAVTGFVLWGVDSGMMWVIGKITHLG